MSLLMAVFNIILLNVKALKIDENAGKSCKRGFFVDTQGNCHRQLNCTEIEKELKFISLMEGGYVKNMTRVKWKNIDLVHSKPKYHHFKEDFKSGLVLLEMLQESQFVLDLVGMCYKPMQVVTKYYMHGSSDNLPILLQTKGLGNFEELKIRLQIARSFLEIINFLHEDEKSPRVMCDSNDLHKTLSQYLITDDFKLVLADLDAVPQLNRISNGKVKCGHRQLFGTFVAPEQLWPHGELEFDDNMMPGYDEKTDIWKIPDIIFFFLGDLPIMEILKFRLFNILKECKSHDPTKRPTAHDILYLFKMESDKMLIENHHLIDEF
eukprot:gene12294-2942_t